MFNNAVIVGGGFAGWYTAAAFRHNFPNCKVTVIDSDKHNRLGVGETLGFSSPHDFKNLLGIQDDRELMRSSGSIYKYGINQDFMHEDVLNPIVKLYNTKIRSLTNFYDEFEWTDFCEPWNQQPGDVGIISAWMTVNQYNKKNFLDFVEEIGEGIHFVTNPLTPEKNGRYALRHQEGWSYHVDAEQVVRFMRKLALSSENITHVSKTITDITLSDNGIENIIFEDGSTISGDLYLDCSGFSRVLFKRLPQAVWHNHGDEYNNAAWVCPSKYSDPESEMIGATNTYGEEHGWRFQLNLYHRRGNGYIFNRNMTDPELPLKRMLEVTDNTRLVDPRMITWSPGYYAETWIGNTIALGISGNFIDPHDAPTFDLHGRALESFLKVMKLDSLENARSQYNYMQTQAVKERELRLIFNFGLSKRKGYWWESRREMIRKNDYFKDLHEIINHKKTDIETKLQYFWHNMYYRMIVTSETDRTQFKFPELTSEDRAMVESFFAYNKQRNKYIAQQEWPNNYQWLKQNRFDGLSSQQILEELHPNIVKGN